MPMKMLLKFMKERIKVLAPTDIILIKSKMKQKGLSVKNLASKIHVNVTKVDRVLNLLEDNKTVEERLLKWLTK